MWKSEARGLLVRDMTDSVPQQVLSDDNVVLTSVVGSTLVIRLNREAKRNAINEAMAIQLGAAMAELEARPDLRCAVLTGTGPVFCAGADLNYIASGHGRLLETTAGGAGGLVRYPRSKPLIAAVNGPAVAAGCELALACDVIVAGESAVFGLPEVTRGIAATAGGIFRWVRALPPGRALLPLLTGEPITASEAERWGLVWSVVRDADVESEAVSIAQRLQRAAPLAVAMTLRLARRASGADGDAVDWLLSELGRDRLAATADAVEGSRAFLERREPVWRSV